MIHRLRLVWERSRKAAQVASAYISRLETRFPINPPVRTQELRITKFCFLFFNLVLQSLQDQDQTKDQIQRKGEYRQLNLLPLLHSFEKAVQCFMNTARFTM